MDNPLSDTSLARLRADPHSEEQMLVEESQTQTRDRLIDAIIGPENDYLYIASHKHPGFYHGRFGGLSILRTVRELCSRVAGEVDTSDMSGADIAEAFESTTLDLPSQHLIATFALLPPRQRLEYSVGIALDHVLNTKECLDRAEFWQHVHSLYERDPEDYTDDDRSFLALVYSLMALGRRHDPDQAEQQLEPHPDRVVARG